MSFRDNGSLDQTLDDWMHKIYGDSKVVFDVCSEINKFFMKVFFGAKGCMFCRLQKLQMMDSIKSLSLLA